VKGGRITRKFICPFCGYLYIFSPKESSKWKKRVIGFTCPRCGRKPTEDDFKKLKGLGPKPKDKRRKRVKKEVVTVRPPDVVQPYIEEIAWRTRLPPPPENIRDLKLLGRSGWKSRPPQPIDRSFEEAVISSMNIRISAPIPNQNLSSGENLEKSECRKIGYTYASSRVKVLKIEKRVST